MTSPPAGPRSQLGRLIANTARMWRRAANRRLQPYGLTEATWLPLLRIARADKPMRQKDLAHSLQLDGSSVVRLLDNLERSGLVTRIEGLQDRRSKEIVLTEEGSRIVARVEGVTRLLSEEATEGLSAEDLAASERVIRHLIDFFEREPGEEESA